MYIDGCFIADPPPELLASVFPWIENERSAFAERRRTIGQAANDGALTSFLNLVTQLRRVLLQDAAVLSTKYRNLPFLSFAPFNTPRFWEFASNSSAILKRAEDEARHRLEKLPETLAMSMRGILVTSSIQNERNLRETQELVEMLSSGFRNLKDSLGALVEANLITSTKKKRKALEAALMTNTGMYFSITLSEIWLMVLFGSLHPTHTETAIEHAIKDGSSNSCHSATNHRH